jgi:hypothetical protein
MSFDARIPNSSRSCLVHATISQKSHNVTGSFCTFVDERFPRRAMHSDPAREVGALSRSRIWLPGYANYFAPLKLISFKLLRHTTGFSLKYYSSSVLSPKLIYQQISDLINNIRKEYALLLSYEER